MGRRGAVAAVACALAAAGGPKAQEAAPPTGTVAEIVAATLAAEDAGTDPSAHGAPLGLSALIGLAEASHPVLLRQRTDIAIAAEALAATGAEYRPGIVARAAAVATERDAVLQDGGSFARDDTQQSASVALDQTLYDGGRRSLRRQAAALRLRAAEARLRGVRRDIAIGVASDYHGYLAARSNVADNEALVALLREDLRAANARERAGDASRTDIAATRSRLALARAGLAGARLALTASLASLASATGRDAADLARGLDAQDADAAPCDLPPSDQVRTLALSADPALLAARLQTAVAKTEAAIAGRANAPTLALAARASTARQVSPVIDENDELSLGLSLTVPIYQGGRGASARRTGALQTQSAFLGEREARRLAELRIAQRLAQLDAARSAVAAQAARSEAAALAAEGIRVGQGVGFYDTIDTLNADADTLAARIDAADARANLRTTIFAVCAEIGAAER